MFRLDVVTFDGLLEYIRDARVLRESGLAAYAHGVHPFGYPALLCLFRLLTPSLFAASRLLSWIAGVSVMVLLPRLIRAVFGAREARWAPLAAVIGSALVAHTLEPSSTLPGAALQLASVLAVVHATTLGTQRPALLAGAGALMGLAWLVRYPSLLVFLATLVWLTARTWREPRLCLVALASYGLPFFALASPQMVLNLRHGVDPFIANDAGYILRAERGGFATGQTVVSMILLEGGRAAAFWLKNFSLFVASHAPLLVAMALVLRGDRSPGVTYLATIVVLQQLVLALTNFNPKFYLLDRWLLLGFAIRAGLELAPRVRAAWATRRTASPEMLLAAAGLGVAAACVAPVAVAYLTFRIVEIDSMLGRDDIGTAHRQITERLYARGYQRRGEVLGCSNVHYDLRALDQDRVTYFRERAMTFKTVPRLTNGAALERFLRDNGFRFVLYDDEERGLCPAMDFLFDPGALPDSLVPIWIDDSFNQTDRLALFELTTPSGAPLSLEARTARYRGARTPSLKGLLDDWASALARSSRSRRGDDCARLPEGCR